MNSMILSTVLAMIFQMLLAGLPISAVSSSYQPKDHYKVQCGATDDIDTWIRDVNQVFSPSATVIATSTNTTPVTMPPGFQPRSPYDKARIFSRSITYSFPLSSPPGPILLRLYFFPNTSYSNIDPTMFYTSVTANEFKLLTNFSAYLVAANANPSFHAEAGFFREFYLTSLNHRHLNLTFFPSHSLNEVACGFINGIEIVSLPDGLYLHTPNGQIQSGIPYLIGGPDDYTTRTFSYSNNTAMETMLRLNVGGANIQPDQDDTGLSRTWFGDTSFLGKYKGFTTLLTHQFVKINYTDATPNYTAPENVYSTMRIVGPSKDPNLKQELNLSLNWMVEVDGDFNYSLRLHFCEFDTTIDSVLQLVFDINVNNQLASSDFDIFHEQGNLLGVPIYRDYVTYVEGPGKRVNLSVQLLPDYNSEFKDVVLNGLEIFKLSNLNHSLAAPNAILSSYQKNSTVNSKNSKHLLPIVIGSVFGFVLLVSFLFLGFYYIRHQKKGMMTESSTLIKSSDNDTTSKMKSWIPIPMDYSTSTTSSIMSLSLPSDLCRRFSLSQIRAATYDFDNSSVIGKGGFGKVYKGTIDGIPAPVAIKRLNSTSKQGAREFLNEIEMLSKLRHMNLVSLTGYCEEQGEMILVYEYMSRGTLRDHLLYKSNGTSNVNTPLSWKQRLMICIGSARGLHYLHAGTKQSIIHRDVKSTNILLDEKWNAKVSDFGLSKVGPASEAGFSHVSTAVKGSVGYLDPEYYRRQQLTDKSDVYSFGVVMFEVLCARTVVDLALPKGEVNLAMWAQSRYKSRNLHTIVDPNIKGQIAPECLNKFGETAELCVRDHGNERPSIGDVVWALEFALQLQLTADNDSFNTNISDGLVEEGLKNSIVVNRDSGDEGITNDDMFTNSGENWYHQGSSASETQTQSDQTKSASVFSEILDPKGR